MSAGLSRINRALNLISKRAEQRQADQLRSTFVDSGVAAALEAIDHQVLYGRRGTGKTHALRYLETEVRSRGDVATYIDLRTVGSPEGLFGGDRTPITERTARLLVDLLGQLHDDLLTAAIEDSSLIVDSTFVRRLDALGEAITSVRIIGETETSQEGERREASKTTAGGAVSLGSAATVSLAADSQTDEESRALGRVVQRGTEQIRLNFSEVARALRDLAASLSTHRVWLLLDEWSSVPPDIQPYLAEFLVRCVLPLQMFTVKIGAIEQHTHFRTQTSSGAVIGLEVGADVAANINLDEFMVFEANEERSRGFFRGLFFKHLTSGVEESEAIPELRRESDLISQGFTDKRAFDELVRAAEGVPRDAINIAAKAGLRAGMAPISVPDVRAAARAWFETDKEGALRALGPASTLLNWVVDKVIREKRARGFLVSQKSAGAPLLLALFDARVLHVVRRGYSAQDEPGERYDVWVIDYGAYVDLIHTKYEPQGFLPSGDDEGTFVDVPTQDLRAIRRAVLNVDAFLRQIPDDTSTAGTGEGSIDGEVS